VDKHLKYITVVILIVNALLYGGQNKADIESLPDAIVVESVPENAVVSPKFYDTKKSHVESLPDATVIEMTPEESKLFSKSHKKKKHTKRRSKKKQININQTNIEKLPEATVVEVFDIDKYGNLIPRKKSDVRQKCNTAEESQIYTEKEPCVTETAGTMHKEKAKTSTNKVKVPVLACDAETISDKQHCVAESTTCEINETVGEQMANTTHSIKPTVAKKQKPIVIVKTITEDQNTKKRIDFWDLLDKTVQNSAKLVLKKYDIAAGRENMELIKNEYYPKISLSYSGEYYHSFSKDRSADIGGSYYPSFSQYRDSVGLGMQYEVYRFGATDLKVKISQKQLEIIRTELALEEEKVSKELLQYFAKALKAQISINYNEELQTIQNRILQKQQRLYEAGHLPKTELMKTERALIQLEKEMLNHKLNLGDAVKSIEMLSNISLNPDEVKLLMLEPRHSKKKQFEESVQAENLRLQIEVKKQEIELIEKDYYPTLALDSGYRLYGSDENSFFKSIENLQRNNWNLGITARWNMFDGYKTQHMILKKKIELHQLQEQYRLASIEFASREKRIDLLKKAYDKILKSETKILDQISEQREIFGRLQSAGKVDTLQLDNTEIDMLKNELSFKINVVDRVYQTILSELTK